MQSPCAVLAKHILRWEKIPEAVALFEKAVKNYPSFAESYFDLARAYGLSSEYNKAVRAYKKVVELAPDSAIVRESEKISFANFVVQVLQFLE